MLFFNLGINMPERPIDACEVIGACRHCGKPIEQRIVAAPYGDDDPA
jgi:hypothetical protein